MKDINGLEFKVGCEVDIPFFGVRKVIWVEGEKVCTV